jgi:4-alpha-glucanotransferase
VPPDFFSADGQLWGNPIYNWARMEEDAYDWWMRRLARCAEMYGETRLDHFRALSSYYVIPAGAKDARSGEWRRGPGERFFEILRKRVPQLTLLAEDLGDITPDVIALREYAGIPGMRVMQFAFDGTDNAFLPHNYDRRTAVYLGTHDNDTTAGFWQAADGETRRRAAAYLGIPAAAGAKEAVRAMMRAASVSAADTVIFTLQDVLIEDSRRRINTPAQIGGCWEYGLTAQPGEADFAFLTEITALYGRTKS